MLCTIILDAYKKNEAMNVANALTDLFDPNDPYGWASAGIYCYWDYYTKELFYIGLAVDLAERFKQHNGLVVTDDKSCKRQQINEYFDEKEKLGFSVFVQSPLSQPNTSKNQMSGIVPRLPEGVGFRKDPARDSIIDIEGILLESYRKKHGSYPKWNKVGGSSRGEVYGKKDSYELINMLTYQFEYPFVSRYSIRELSKNPRYERFENSIMHPARFYLMYTPMSPGQSLDTVLKFDSSGTYQEMVKEGYFERKLTI